MDSQHSKTDVVQDNEENKLETDDESIMSDPYDPFQVNYNVEDDEGKRCQKWMKGKRNEEVGSEADDDVLDYDPFELKFSDEDEEEEIKVKREKVQVRFLLLFSLLET